MEHIIFAAARNFHILDSANYNFIGIRKERVAKCLRL